MTPRDIEKIFRDEALRLGLRRGEVDFIFGDAISLAFWINGTDSAECCAFSGGMGRLPKRMALFRADLTYVGSVARHSGARAARTMVRDCAPENLEIPGSMLRIAPE